MKTIFATTLCFIFFSLHVLATHQRNDYIEYDGRLYRFGTFGQTPLQDYFLSKNLKPPKQFKAPGSNLWRGHIAHWRVADNKLWLVSIYVIDEFDLDGPSMSNLVIFPLSRLFPGKEAAVHASWYSGKLTISPDKVADFLDEQPDDKSASSLSLEFKNGMLVAPIGRNIGEPAGADQPATKPEDKPPADVNRHPPRRRMPPVIKAAP